MFHSGGNGGNDVGICVSENWRIAGRYDKGSDFETGRDSFVYCFLFMQFSQNACAYFRRTFLKRINIQLKRDVFDAGAGSGYDPVYEQQQWDVSLNTE